MKFIPYMLAAMLLAPCASHAAEEVQTLSTNFGYKMPSKYRLAILGSFGGMVGESDYTNADGSKDTSASNYAGGLLLGFGDGTFTFEVGAQYMSLPVIAPVDATETGDNQAQTTSRHRLLINGEFVGFPLLVKYNYIDRPLSTFYVKAGATPIVLVRQSVSYFQLNDNQPQQVSLNKADVLAVAGVGGTAAVGESTAFILDVSGFYGFSEIVPGGGFQGAMVSIGFSYDI